MGNKEVEAPIFNAIGPLSIGIGFLARVDGHFKKGVVGIGSGKSPDQIKDTIGVLGETSRSDEWDPANGKGVGNGKGVVGRASGDPGIGVQGQGFQDATGVQGTSERSAGVQGISDTGNGVDARGKIGVFGFGAQAGVIGTSAMVGVLGGSPIGRVFDGTFSVGVVGTRASHVGDDGVPFSYGGWFDAPTAPLHLEPSTAAVPTAVAQRGDFFVDNSGKLWFCTDGGDPATWRQVQLI